MSIVHTLKLLSRPAIARAFFMVFVLMGALSPTAVLATVTSGNAGALRMGAGSNLCLDGGSYNLRAMNCDNGNAQRWTLKPNGGWFQVVLSSTGECLSLESGARNAGARAVRAACTGAAHQRFSLRALDNGGHALVASHSGRCIGATGSGVGSAVQQQNCVDNNGQQRWLAGNSMWTVAPLKSAVNGLCLDIPRSSTSNGTQTIAWSCHGGANQQFKMIPRPDGSLGLQAQNSGKCLDVYGRSQNDGAAIIQWQCQDSDNQRFHARVRNGSYELVAKHSGKCVSLETNNATNGVHIVQSSCDGSPSQAWKRDGATAVSRWTAPMPLTIVPVAASLLPNGKVMTWSAFDRLGPGNGAGKTYTSLVDPITGEASETLVSNTGHDMLCPGTANLPDGRLLVNGGATGPNTSIYDWNTNRWSAAAVMHIPRGYQGSATLSSGKVFVVGGSWGGGIGGKGGEVWDGGNNSWTLRSGILAEPMATADSGGMYRADNHMWLFADRNDRVLHAGPSRTMHWIDTAGNRVVALGPRHDDLDAMNGNATMFGPREVLVTGGSINYQGSPARNGAYRISYTAEGTVTVTKLPPMAYARAVHNSVVLPTSEVLVVGGQTQVQLYSDSNAVLAPEIWNPRTNTFTVLAPQTRARNYHSTALLLADGRVISGGGGLCGTCNSNHPDVEILSPPYLLNPDGTEALRPRLFNPPTTAQRGGTLTLAASNDVEQFQLVRLSSVTHSLNTEQRRVPLALLDSSERDDSSRNYNVRMNADNGVLLPGYYLLFAINRWGRVSQGAFVRVP